MANSSQRAKPSAQHVRIIKILITASALFTALIGATAFTNGPEPVMDTATRMSFTEALVTSDLQAALDTVAGPGYTESLKRTAGTLIAPAITIFGNQSETNVPCAVEQ